MGKGKILLRILQTRILFQSTFLLLRLLVMSEIDGYTSCLASCYVRQNPEICPSNPRSLSYTKVLVKCLGYEGPLRLTICLPPQSTTLLPTHTYLPHLYPDGVVRSRIEIVWSCPRGSKLFVCKVSSFIFWTCY